MGTETIPDRSSGQSPTQSWINNFRDALSGALVPRFLNGLPRNSGGRLGNTTYKWKNYNVFTGDLGVGDVLPWYDYAGSVSLPQGWMLCNGVIINQANYDTQHASGDWANYVVSTVLNGLYLPDMNDNHPIGTTAAMQAGSSPITTTGAHTNNLAHVHGTNATTGGASANTIGLGLNAIGESLGANGHTHVATWSSSLSSTKNIEPEHLLAKFIMRVV